MSPLTDASRGPSLTEPNDPTGFWATPEELLLRLADTDVDTKINLGILVDNAKLRIYALT